MGLERGYQPANFDSITNLATLDKSPTITSVFSSVKWVYNNTHPAYLKGLILGLHEMLPNPSHFMEKDKFCLVSWGKYQVCEAGGDHSGLWLPCLTIPRAEGINIFT